MTWQIDLQPPDSTIRQLLHTDRRWTAYALGDLHPPFRARSAFLAATRGEDWAVLLIYRTAMFNAIQPFGPADGVRELLAAAPKLPQNCIISNATGDQEAVLEEFYTFGSMHLTYRMYVTAELFKPFNGACEQLTTSNVPEMSAFYTMNDVTTFSPDQVQHGLYFGVRRHNILVAIGGTHLIAAEEGLGAIGNIYVDPMVRGQGFARIITSELTRRLMERGCEEVVLNVEKINHNAIRAYEHLGFARHSMFWEGPARLKESRKA
jgi:ribosomal protein S18 acetylase RimI-like enzyme